MKKLLSRRSLVFIAIASVAILVTAGIIVNASPRSGGNLASDISVTGLVNHEIFITLDDLKSRPNVTIRSELICVGGTSLGTHNWTGVMLKDLLSEAVVKDGAMKVVFNSSSHYSTDLSVQDAMSDNVVVAFLKDGIPIPEGTKLVVPGKWGYKWIDGISSIQIVDFDFLGTWESRGYSDDASITT